MKVFYFLNLLLWTNYLYSSNIIIERKNGKDVIYKERKIKAADVYASKNIYFFVILENGHSLLKALNYSEKRLNQFVDVLQFPVQSAQSVAIDWVNGNLYWADRINRFLEVVDISHDLSFPIGKRKRRILFSQDMADIDSMVVDPWEQYIFWLQIGAGIVLERAKLNGQERMVIYRSYQFKSSFLAIDRHTKMLYWLGMHAVIHRVDYQGRSGCNMLIHGNWTIWKPSFLVFSDSKLYFILNGEVWSTEFKCGSGAAYLDSVKSLPGAIVAVGYQLAMPGNVTNQCLVAPCRSLCLPSSASQYQCSCSTGISYIPNNSSCPDLPSRSLFISSPPRIYQISLDVDKIHMDPIYEDSGIPFRLAYDSLTSSIFYVDYNSSSIHVISISGYGPSQPLVFDSSVLFQEPSNFALDSRSRNIYWMNYQTSEVWVAQISTSYQLRNTALLLSWKIDQLSTNRHHVPLRGKQALLPGELAVDSSHRFLFVSAIRNGAATVERYWLDGTNKFVIVNSADIKAPCGLALDSEKQELFFVDTAKDEMIAVGYSGNNFRVIARRISDFFGLTFLDGYIYWTDLEKLTVNKIRSDGEFQSTLVSTHNLRTATMPIVAMSKEFSYSLASPCRNTTHICDQLCFPTPISYGSYSCGCSNSLHLLLNMSRCTRQDRVLLLYNSSHITVQNLISSRERNKDLVFELSSDTNIASVQLDRFRNFIYWIDRTKNCVMKGFIGTNSNVKSQIFCLTTDKIMSISIDATRNNLYVSIRSPIWSRIEIIRLPFENSEIIYRKVVVSITKDSPFIDAITSHSGTKRIFWITSISDRRFSSARVFQADLDGSKIELLWSGIADVDELVVNDNGMYLYWRSSQSGTIYKYYVYERTKHVIQLPLYSFKESVPHMYATDRHLYLSQNSSIFHVNVTFSKSTVTTQDVKLFINISNQQLAIEGFAIYPQNVSSKMALIKSDLNLGSVVMCPNDETDTFSTCAQICLPSTTSMCSCGYPYSLKSDGFSCSENNNYLLVVTSSGEVIGLEMKPRLERPNELEATEWIEIPEHQPLAGKRFIDAIYWSSKSLVLLLDNEGELMGKHRSWPSHKSKVYKHLTVLKEDISRMKLSTTYEKAYHHFLTKDQTYRDQYESSRYSLTLDPISDTLIWSDWIDGVIVSEKLNSDLDAVEYLGIVVDFRQSKRRPLKVAVAPISSSLIWISADLETIGSNGNSSIWRKFWIEWSDLDGGRRTVLSEDPGLPSCLTVDGDTGRVYWIDKRSNMIMYLHFQWEHFEIRGGHVLGRRLKVTVNSILTTGIGHSSSAMTVLKKHLVWADWFQQIVASASLNERDNHQLVDTGNRMGPEKIQVFELTYIKQKLKNVVKLLARLGDEDFRTSSVGSLFQNHPCSHTVTAVKGPRCSHLCLSTIPISLAEGYNSLMTTKQLGGKFRCACPYDMSIRYTHTQGQCLQTSAFRCEDNEFLCRAGHIFIGKEILKNGNCLSVSRRCDSIEDCLDGSDEAGCNHCNVSHPYSCSGSKECLEMTKRCDGIGHCSSDESCCSEENFECLTDTGPNRCIAVSMRCDGVRHCSDGSDESKCQLADNGKRGNTDITIIRNIRDNHLVAIVTGCVALLACSVAIIYICVSRRNRHKTVHESCVFRTNNVNIMFMPNSARSSRHPRPRKPPSTMFHAQSCDVLDVYKSQHDSDQLTKSLTSLSDIYQRIRNPYPDRFAALKIPLFTIQDDVLFNFNRFRRVQDPYTSSDSNEKFENPPPSEATANSEESVNLIARPTDNEDNIAQSSEMMTPCESELEEIYFHRYRSHGPRSPSHSHSHDHQYPSRLLQMLLTSNHSNYLQDRHSATVKTATTTTTTSTFVRRMGSRQHRDDHQRRKRLHKHQKRRHGWKTNLSLSPQRKLYCSHESLAMEAISPPPPSPITVEPA